MPAAVSSFDFSDYDLLISTSSAVAKGARPPKGALHICYCHSPMRYIWDQYDDYFGAGKSGLFTRTAMRAVVPYLRRWDVRTSSRVTHFIANSRNVAERIQRLYGRTADVLYAPVDTEKFPLSKSTKGYFLMVSALVPYKKVEIAIRVFNDSGKRLIIIGKGPEQKALQSTARSNIEFFGWQSDDALAKYYAGCRALIFPGVEDFGIVPLEAMACGKPVIAFAKGGALETVIGKGRKATGIFFQEQTTESLRAALEVFENSQFDPAAIRDHALLFDRAVFKQKLQICIDQVLSARDSS
jgi:glycosyltransferase involved in cell wall biosynthesis